MKKFFLHLITFQILLAFTILAQNNISPNIRSGVMNANNVKTIFNNTGVLGQPNNGKDEVAWKYEHNGYFGDLSFLVGVELPIKDYTGDSIPDTLHEVIITPVNRPGGGNTNGINGGFGGFLPTPGYFNPAINKPDEGVAINTIPETWPNKWPDHPEYGSNVWNGFFGKDSAAGDQEAFFEVNDSSDAKYYKKYKFLPVPDDSSRYGFGITVKVRYIELKNPVFKDVLFRVYDIKNESKFNYPKIVFGNLSGTYIGGNGDEWNDDVSFYDSTNNIIFSWDKEPGKGFPYVRPIANPQWKPNPYSVGTVGETFLQSPVHNKINSFQYFIPAGSITLSQAEEMWKRLTDFPSGIQPIDTARGEDGDYIYGSEAFSLNSGETKRVASALVFGNDKQDVLSKTQLAEILWNNNFDTKNIFNKVSFLQPSFHKQLSGIENIKWNSVNSGGYVDIWFSSDAGSTWQNIVRNASNSGNYSWNTAGYNDCSFGKLKIIVKDDNKKMYGINESSYFSINNNGTAAPFVKIMNTEFDSQKVFTEKNYDFNLLIGSINNDSLLCKVFYSYGDNFTFYQSQQFYVYPDTTEQKIPISFSKIINSDIIKIKIEVTSGTQSWSDATPFFNKQTPREYLGPSNFKKIAGFAKVPIKIVKVNPQKFTGDTYKITFNDTTYENQKLFSVYDVNKKSYVLKNISLIPFIESPVFDGLALYTEDIQTSLDTLKSRWNHPDSNNLKYKFNQINDPSTHIKGYKYPFDYMITFSNSYNDSSNTLYKLLKPYSLKSKLVNFKVYDVTDSLNPRRIKFAFIEPQNFRTDTLSNLDQVILSNEDGSMLSWDVLFQGTDKSNVPSEGDTLFLYTKKGISFLDTLEITGLTADVKVQKKLPHSFKLEQNYPNPFNPTTIIEYQIPRAAHVSLKIYDILGSVVSTLINEQKNAGSYKVQFDAKRFASGVYIYQLKAGNYISAKKMVLLK